MISLVPKFFINIQKRDGVLNSEISIATIKALIARKPNCFVISTACWAKRLFERASFKRGAAMTGKLMIPEGAWKEEELVYDYKIVSIVENYKIHTP